MTERTTWPLPIRFAQRGLAQLILPVFSIFFTGVAIFIMSMAAEITANADQWVFRLFPLFGIPFVVIGMGLFVSSVATWLPDSPLHHIQIDDLGIVVRTLFKRKFFPWSAISAFDPSERKYRDKDGDERVSYYAIALPSHERFESVPAEQRHNRSLVQIDASDIGSGEASLAAADLVAWLNELRDLANAGKLHPGLEIAVPPTFRDAIRLPGGVATTPKLAPRSQTVQRG